VVLLLLLLSCVSGLTFDALFLLSIFLLFLFIYLSVEYFCVYSTEPNCLRGVKNILLEYQFTYRNKFLFLFFYVFFMIVFG
jgi:phosphatidylglycerophosphate synthase